MFAGSPYSPRQRARSRLAYAAIGLCTGIAVNFGNALVSVNVQNLAGEMGDTIVKVSALPAIFVAFNVSANLMLVKSRAQFGIPLVTRSLLGAYAVTAAVQALAPGFATAVLVRAASGMTAAGLTTLTVYYFMQCFSARTRPLALVLAIGCVQLGTPLARLLPVEFLGLSRWRALCLTEFAVAVGIIALITWHPLPPSDRVRQFKPLDFVTFPVFLAANLCLCIVLAEGRLLWWQDTPWLGVALVASVACYAAALTIEVNRKEPLFRLRWLGSVTIIRFALVALVVRFALAEQSYGAIGLLGTAGLNNDQYHKLFTWVAVAEVFGIIIACLTLSERRIPYQVATAALLIAVGAGLDATSTNLTRPENIYFSQALIAFGTTLFVGPALVYGVARMLQQGGTHLVSFVVLFSVSQNIGGLIGSATLGTYQVERARFHATTISERIQASDPAVSARLQAGGPSALSQSLNREAAILSYNDLAQVVVAVALAAAAFVIIAAMRAELVRRRRQPEANA